MGSAGSVEDFYNSINDRYTEYILRCVPRYAEMQWAILHYIPNGLKPKRILDLGCGQGNLTDLLIEKYRDSEIHLVDISREMIYKCQSKYDKNSKIITHCTDFRNLDFKPGSFDLIVSSISIHHITDSEKEKLFHTIFQLLNSPGIFSFSDQFSSTNEEIYRKNIQLWKTESSRKRTSEAEWKMWMEHQDTHDYHTTLENQLLWLQKAGFKKTDCVWRYLLWTVVTGSKENISRTRIK